MHGWIIGAIILGGLLILFSILYYSLIKVVFNGTIKGIDLDARIQVFIWRFRVFNLKVPKIAIEEDPIHFIVKYRHSLVRDEKATINGEEAESLFHTLRNVWGILKKRNKMKEVFRICDLVWETEIGCDQADWTAMITGLVWALKTNGLGLLHSLIKIEGTKLNVIPFFNQWKFETHLSCMISFRLGKAIRQAVWIRKQIKRRRLSNGRTSHTRVNEDSA